MCATSSRNSPVHIRLNRRGEGGEGRSIYSKLFGSDGQQGRSQLSTGLPPSSGLGWEEKRSEV